jgi:hypothetical protein
MDDRITVRINSAMLARIHAWIADQSGYVSRQEAVRWCVELVFSRGGSPSVECSRDQSVYAPKEEKPPDNEVVYLDWPRLPQQNGPVR